MNSLQHFLAIMVKHRRFIFWDSVIVTALVIIYSLIVPPSFTSSAQILPPSSDESSLMDLSSVLGSGGGLSSMMRLGSGLKGMQNSDLIAAILSSRTVRERVMDSCDFMTVSRIRKSRELALKQLSKLTRIRVTDEGIVVVSVEGKTAVYAARLAASYVTELDRFMRESNMSRGRNTRLFIGKRLLESEQELAAVEESLVAFQRANRVTAVDEETKAAVESYAKLRAEKIAADIELGFARDLAGDSNPYVENLRQRNAEFDRQLSGLERGGTTQSGFGVGFGVPLTGVPEVAAEYLRRFADLKLKTQLRALLVQQYEQAKITEVRDTPAITLLDPPRVPERRSFPHRTRLTFIALAASLVFGMLMSLLLEFWERQRQDEPTWQEWRRIAVTLKDDVSSARRIGRRRPKSSVE